MNPLRTVAAARWVVATTLAPLLIAPPLIAQAPPIDSELAQPWSGPHGGVPPFDAVQIDRLVGDFDDAIAAADSEIDRIAHQSEPPTFENTLVALDNTASPLRRLETIFDVHASNLNVGPIPDIERAVAPKLSSHSDRIYQNGALFQRIEAVAAAEPERLPADAKRLLTETRDEFVRRGARLSGADQAKLTQINGRLARLFTDFSQNVLEEEKRHVTWIDDPSALAGLPKSVVTAMAAAAKEKGGTESGGQGRYAVINTRSSMEPFLTYAEDRSLRKQVWENYYSRCDHGDEFDNKSIIAEITRLRAARASLIGYQSHAHWRMRGTMAGTPEAAMALMMKVWPAAKARVAEEVADMQAIATQQTGDPGFQIEPWDYRYYAEKVRAKRYDLDMAEVRPYLQMDRLVDGMFWVAGELFGWQFNQIDGVPVFHPDVTVHEVRRGSEHIGLFYFDPFAREGKRSGAWMTDYREQSGAGNDSLGVPRATPIVSNNCNFVDSGDGPPLISWDDATTLFHEFGHAVHGLASRVRFRSQSGTNVARDFVEFPSQLLEHWLATDEVLTRFATNLETAEPLPAALLAKIRAAEKFNAGFETTEYLACAIVDMMLHSRDQGVSDIAAFEREVLAEIGMPEQLPMRHRLPHFSHLFSSDAYSAGYYSYLWSDALTADAAERFEQADGGYYDAAVASDLMDHVLSVGDTVDPKAAFEKFRGRAVQTDALLRKKGF